MRWGMFVWVAANAVRVIVFYTVLTRTFVLVAKGIEAWYTEDTTTTLERR